MSFAASGESPEHEIELVKPLHSAWKFFDLTYKIFFNILLQICYMFYIELNIFIIHNIFAYVGNTNSEG
jgi:hypothetical protein